MFGNHCPAGRFALSRRGSQYGRARDRASFWYGVASLVLCWLCAATAFGAGDDGTAGTGGFGGSANVPATGSHIPVINAVSAKDVVRGSPVTVSGENFGNEPKSISLTFGEISVGHPTVASDKSFTFIVPETVGETGKERPMPLGEALLRVSIESPPHVVNMAADPYDVGRLHVTADGTANLKLNGVSPSVATSGDLTKVILLGDGLPMDPKDLALLVDGVEVPLCWDATCPIRADVTSHQLTLQSQKVRPMVNGVPKKDFNLSQLIGAGKHQLALRSGEQTATDPVDITISKYTSAEVRWWAFGLCMVLLLLMAVLAAAGGTYTVGRTHYVWRAFLIDTETESYSLGKLQFFMWSVAVLLGYAYLVLSRFLVQGQFGLPDVPEGLPGIILLSAATTAGSIGITAARGPKGAGSATPSFSDLVSVGGVVSPERFQFLLWTFVAVFTFLAAALQIDPLQIDTLPAIPPTLLALSGVSAAGYLGGKVVRSPGPVIAEVLVGAGSMLLTINGRNLSRFARFEMNGRSLTPLLAAPTADFVLQPETGTGADEFAKSLKLVIAKPDPTWLIGGLQPPRLELSIINQDGQRSAYELSVDKATWLAFTGLSAPAVPSPLAAATPEPELTLAGVPPTDNTSHNTLDPEGIGT